MIQRNSTGNVQLYCLKRILSGSYIDALCDCFVTLIRSSHKRIWISEAIFLFLVLAQIRLCDECVITASDPIKFCIFSQCLLPHSICRVRIWGKQRRYIFSNIFSGLNGSSTFSNGAVTFNKKWKFGVAVVETFVLLFTVTKLPLLCGKQQHLWSL